MSEWRFTGRSEEYDHSIASMGANEPGYAYLSCKPGITEPIGSATLTQQPADTMQGRWVCFSAKLWTVIDKGWSCLFLSIERGPGADMAISLLAAPKVMVIDHVAERMHTVFRLPVSGVTDWTHYEIAVRIPTDAVCVAYGFKLRGTGSAGIGDAQVHVVDPEVRGRLN